MTTLFNIDLELFQFINQVLRLEWMDIIMPFWRSKYLWGPVYLFLFTFLVINFSKKGWFLVLSILFTVGIADMTSSHLLKKTIQRERPCKNPMLKTDLNLLVRCGSGYSLPSSHATNHFAIASILILTLGQRFKWIKWPLILWAASIAYGQVYVGVHYPFDIICGGILGCSISWLIHKIIQNYKPEIINFAEF